MMKSASTVARRAAGVACFPFGLVAAGGAAVAQEAAQAAQAAVPDTGPAFDPASTAWILTATALVLFMTMPGLALFYGGLVQIRNVLSVLMHCVAIACLMSVLWMVGAYGLAFGDGGGLNGVIGGLGKAFMAGVDRGAVANGLPESVFFMFQMTFAIITPGLIVGAYVERIRFGAVLLFSGLWLVVVYAPVCHWVWGGGWLAGLGVMDFAGGLVVHATAGVAAIVIAVMLGRRDGFPEHIRPPHNPAMTMIGAAMLWVGWYGFNAGSALAADQSAGMALTVTHISAAAAGLTWMALEKLRFGKPSMVGAVTGLIAGLATITPGSGYVGPIGGLVYGVAASLLCFAAVQWIKHRLKVDDSLDVMAVHGVGGILGTLLTAVFALEGLGGVGLGTDGSVGGQLGVQALGVVAVCAWSAIASIAIVLVAKATTGLRVSREAETEGLDLTAHGERAQYD
ncbi:MAG: ammonium transporter [Alphaproteobacteria bacterium]